MSDPNMNRNEAEVLRQLIGEMRETEPPAIDSQRISTMLVETIEAERHFRPVSQQGPAKGQWFVFAAAAAFMVVMLSQQGVGHDPVPNEASTAAALVQPVDLSTVPSVQPSGEAVPVYNVSALRSGSVVESGDEPLRFGLAGIVTWTLAPKTRVRVRTTSSPHEVVLERGMILAEVTPQLRSDALNETFAVIAGTSRVAVHGTVFSVERTDERVLVEVSRGVVSVGPAGRRGPTAGRLLVGPARAAFTTQDGRLSAEQPAALVAASEASPGSEEQEASEPAARADVVVKTEVEDKPATGAEPVKSPMKAPASDEASPEADSEDVDAKPDADENADTKPVAEPEPAAKPKLSVGQVRAMVLACLNANRDSDKPSNLQVTVSSQVNLKVNEAGEIRSVRFNPPLKPSLQQSCGAALFGKPLDAQGDASFRIHFAPR